MDISEIHQLFLTSTGINTDTRTLQQGNLFFALSGDNFNGNTYASKAIERGASYAIVDDSQFYDEHDYRYILVENTLQTLQNLATYHRSYLDLPIIALTGSNGKTTTKELIAAVLSQSYQVVATKGNLNNHIGVPLTLLSMDRNTEIGIVEMGANHQKEIEFLCSIAQPDYGYITNIGKAHLEGFGGIEGVLKGKTELYQYLRSNKKLVFINTDDKKLLKKTENIRKFSFTTQSVDADVKVKSNSDSEYVGISFQDQNIKTQLVGDYNITNIACAIAIGTYFKVSPEKIKEGIENYIPNNNRSQIIKTDDRTILLDAYNANPSSMKAALDNFERMSFKTKLVVLGDMFELGEESTAEHKEIVAYAEKKEFTTILLIGEHFSTTTPETSSTVKVKNTENARPIFEKLMVKHEGILLKGSRGMQLEKLMRPILREN
ncbi:UDP-N-acetylmuramoyl-tripeptide--D-alanyl-D-alanine ligase [Aquimarina sp. ERC-38]|uniref:UDP-N-acetylmuramoyl-tripeptide--D-alanyl-D- alanine ligase n=1 Tax=Aquimarina sp. ERC-38 TaxID=2949996 RepID=UPI00224527EA|nr:UDP-N-acetylmuramoyl-tripeptide--D-alanyl-D-alanine ligase [Aquimarina sp. ERC-38]UZO82434.1 UDP-N-acetylmuramoyl-tripeptide--D-alanyl-D-alanine ligase [Aquimarina sp. ERC-38]